MLAHRLRRRANIKTIFDQRLLVLCDQGSTSLVSNVKYIWRLRGLI